MKQRGRNTESLTRSGQSLVILMAFCLLAVGSPAVVFSGDKDGDSIFRRSNFSNEFELTTPEGINARGTAFVNSKRGSHHVQIEVNGLTPGSEYVIVNHWFEPVPDRGVGPSDPEVDPSCNGHFQFLGEAIHADKKGELKVNTRVDQLAPHVWVVDLAKFLEVTANGTQAPSSPDAFTTGGLLIPYADLLDLEGLFVPTDPLTNCDPL